MQCETFGCHGSRDKIGILVAQLGTPDAPSAKALYPYLKQFLWDPRVIERNRFIWWFVLNFIVLTRRPRRSAALYKRIWRNEGSPLLNITMRQVKAVAENLLRLHPGLEVEVGMRYGRPSLEYALDALIDRGCTKILLFPMYPQYSATTTASTYDVVFSKLLKRRFVPTLRVAEPYYEHPLYVQALASTINEALAGMPAKPERLVLTYHGIPEAYVRKGDPYCCMCTETTAALLPLLSFSPGAVIHTYQSRFGKDPWLEPYTDVTVHALARSGVKRIALACPGFLADCLETLDEMGNELRRSFRVHGGESLELIPCLNDHPSWIYGMTEIVRAEINSWLASATRRVLAGREVSCPIEEAKRSQSHAGLAAAPRASNAE